MPALVSVPLSDRSDLDDLRSKIDGSQGPVESRPFDGAVAVQILVPLTATSITLLRLWLKERYGLKKAQKVTIDGMTFEAHSAEDIAHILEAMEHAKDDTSQ